MPSESTCHSVKDVCSFDNEDIFGHTALCMYAGQKLSEPSGRSSVFILLPHHNNWPNLRVLNRQGASIRK